MIQGSRVKVAADTTSRGMAERVAPMISTLLPSYPDLPLGDRERVECEVAGYVAYQLAAMPGFLRIPYRAALSAFERLPLLRYGKRFRDLDPERRAAYLAQWSDAPVAPMRDFVRLIRGTALLVYFDHPRVREQLEAERRGDGDGAPGEGNG